MANNQLVEYVKRELENNSTQEKIRNDLKTSGGWTDYDIDEAFSENNIQNIQQVGQTNIPVPPVKYAGFGIRWVAFIVDGLIIGIPLFLIYLTIFSLNTFSVPEDDIIIPIIQTIINLIFTYSYFIITTYFKGATFGKMMVGIHVVSADGSRPSFGGIFLRETVGRFLSGLLLFIGYIMVFFTQKKQSLHDKIAKTVVIYKNPPKDLSPIAWIAIIAALILPIIAIIGILSSVILASLNTAREKGLDAEIKHNLMELKIQSEIYTIDNNSYLPANDCFSGMFIEKDFVALISENKSKDVSCKSYADSYAVSAQLSDQKYFCVDSAGYGGDGFLTDDGERVYCVQDSEQSEIELKENVQKIQTNKYSVDLPSDWQIAETSEEYSSAVNQMIRTSFMVDAIQMPENYLNVRSIFDVVKEEDVEVNLKSQFPDILIKSITFESVDGVDAIITNFNSGEILDKNNQPTYLSATQYNILKDGINYTIVLMSSVSSTQSPLGLDKNIIMNTFKFLD